MKREVYNKMHQAWLDATGAKEGDYVKVLKRFTGDDTGDIFGWEISGGMDKTIGTIGKIVSTANYGIRVEFTEEDYWYYPYSVLEIVDAPPTITNIQLKNNLLVIDDDGVASGCFSMNKKQAAAWLDDADHLLDLTSRYETYITIEGNVIGRAQIREIEKALGL